MASKEDFSGIHDVYIEKSLTPISYIKDGWAEFKRTNKLFREFQSMCYDKPQHQWMWSTSIKPKLLDLTPTMYELPYAYREREGRRLGPPHVWPKLNTELADKLKGTKYQTFTMNPVTHEVEVYDQNGRKVG